MKKLQGILIATAMTMASQASMSTPQNGSEYFGRHTVIVAPPQTVIQSVPVRVKTKKFVKSKSVRYIPLRADESDDVFVQEEDLATGYRRRDLTKLEHPDDISEKVRWRLFLARQLALLKYKEVHG